MAYVLPVDGGLRGLCSPPMKILLRKTWPTKSRPQKTPRVIDRRERTHSLSALGWAGTALPALSKRSKPSIDLQTIAVLLCGDEADRTRSSGESRR